MNTFSQAEVRKKKKREDETWIKGGKDQPN